MAKESHRRRYRELREAKGLEQAYLEALREIGHLHSIMGTAKRLVVGAALSLPDQPEKARHDLTDAVKVLSDKQT